jgi:predicted permease
MTGFAIVLSFLAIGFALQQVPQVPAGTASWLTKYVINVAVPAMVLLHVPGLSIDSTLWVPVVTPWVMLTCSIILVLLVSRWRGWSREVTGALLIVVPLGNTSFLGFPIIESFYGDGGMAYAVLYDQFGSFIGLAVVATTLAAYFGKPLQEKQSLGGLALQVLRFPPFVALVIALFLLSTESKYPPSLEQLIRMVSVTLVPVVMVAVGLQLQLKIPRHDLAAFVFSLSAKLILMPALALLALLLTGLDGLAVKVSVLEAAMPPMITAGAIAMAAGLRTHLVSAIIGYGVLVSVLTLPLWYLIIEWVF